MNYYQEYLENQRGLSEYSFDGAINPQKWKESKPKILFVLKENWGYQGCGIIRTEDLAHRWLDAGNTKTYKKTTILATTIHEALRKGRCLTDDEIKGIQDDADLLHNILDTIAVVNLKKHSGRSKSKDTEIRDEARKNAPLLNKQISDLTPAIIIAGSTVCWDRLRLDFNLFDVTPSCPKHHAVYHEGMVLCHSNHPSAWSGGGFPIEKLHCEILKAYNEE